MIAVVVTTFSVPFDTLARCIRSVVSGGDADSVIVVDNGGLAKLPSDAGEQVSLVRAPTNRGFGAAANLGIRTARAGGATAIALLNDDVEVEAGWLGPLVAQLDPSRRIGAVQPKLLLAGTAPVQVNSAGVRLDRYGAARDIGFAELDGPAFAAAGEIDIFTGGAVLFDAGFLDELGGFDERFFMYYEDVDLALRGRERGWTYRCVPAAQVWHTASLSASALGHRRTYLLERNRLWCLWRFADRSTIGAGLWLSVRRVRHRPRMVHVRALLAGLSGLTRRWERGAASRASGHLTHHQ